MAHSKCSMVEEEYFCKFEVSIVHINYTNSANSHYIWVIDATKMQLCSISDEVNTCFESKYK